MHPLDTKVYLLKRYRPSDSFCSFFSESVGSNMDKPKCWVKNVIKKNVKLKVKVEVGLKF